MSLVSSNSSHSESCEFDLPVVVLASKVLQLCINHLVLVSVWDSYFGPQGVKSASLSMRAPVELDSLIGKS